MPNEKATPGRKTSSSKPKPAVLDGPLAKEARKGSNSGRYVIGITSYRARSVDPDNLCGKWFVDSLRYAGIIPDDTERQVIYQITQKKVSTKEERTEIEITFPCLESSKS